jgi:hypothetical protein
LCERNIVEARGTKSGFERSWVERYERVVDVASPNPVSIEGVHRHEPAAGSQHSVHFGEQKILRPFRGHVVQHGEAGRGRESIGWQWQLGGVAADNLDIGTGEADRQVGCESDVDLDCCHRRDAVPPKISGQTWPRADLQHVIAQLDDRFKPGE